MGKWKSIPCSTEEVPVIFSPNQMFKDTGGEGCTVTNDTVQRVDKTYIHQKGHQ